MRHKLVWQFAVAGLMIGTAFAQDAPPTGVPDAGIVHVRIGRTGGMCDGAGYCTNLTTVEQSFIGGSGCPILAARR